jgi:hypothetical protein
VTWSDVTAGSLDSEGACGKLLVDIRAYLPHIRPHESSDDTGSRRLSTADSMRTRPTPCELDLVNFAARADQPQGK